MENADVQTAVVAREALEGHSIYDGGFCKLHLSYSRHTDLSIKVANVNFFTALGCQYFTFGGLSPEKRVNFEMCSKFMFFFR